RPRTPPDLHSFLTRRSSDLRGSELHGRRTIPGSREAHDRRGRLRREAKYPAGGPALRRGGPGPLRYDLGRDPLPETGWRHLVERDRKSTRLNSSHVAISYAV